MPLFRNRNENQDESPALEEIGAAWVPASMRERPVPATMPIEDDDGPDAQLEFLQGLVSEIEGGPKRAAPEAIASARADGDDAMWAFHEPAPRVDPLETLRSQRIEDVALDDLVDELSLTAAALRQRRAA